LDEGVTDSPRAVPPPLEGLPAWADRYRAPRVSLPDWALDAPDHCVFTANFGGKVELYAWDRATDTRRQATDRPEGTAHGGISPDGEWIWWFADTDGDEFGVWRRQPFEGGADEVAVDGVPAAYPAGLEIGPEDVTVVGTSDDDGTAIFVHSPGDQLRTVYASEHDASVGALSRDGRLLVLEHSEHGDSRHPALRSVRLADATEPTTVPGGAAVLADLWDGPGKGLEAVAFSPIPGDPRVLVVHERHDRPELLLWDAETGAVTELAIDLPGDLEADFYPDGSALLVHHDHHGRSGLYRYDLVDGTLTDLEVPRGLVGSATARPDGSVWFSWSSSELPSRVQDLSGAVVLAPTEGRPPAPGVPARDVWADGEGGPVHALVCAPAGPPRATVFLVHGGPTAHDVDGFSAEVAAYVDNGYQVVQVNYRGSTGYGSAWRDALEADIGHTELADLATVRAHLVATGEVDPDRIVLAGASWGGYLTLLGVGAQPELWTVGVAEVPVADYVAAFADEMEGLKAFDRSLFGGSPDEVPEKYRRASPITYVDEVRAPVLITIGENDPRCPARQVDNYLARLAERRAPHAVYRFDAGHGSLVMDERVRQAAIVFAFLDEHLPAVG
jgi:dienelactone hydrolase